MDIIDLIEAHNGIVLGHETTLDRGIEALDNERSDACILNIRLGQEMVYELADRLMEMGIPFIFASSESRSDIPDRFADVPLHSKPIKAAAGLMGRPLNTDRRALMSDLWGSERRLWLEGVAAYEELMAPECLMAFGPMSIVKNEQIIESLREAPRWADVVMTDRTRTSPVGDVAIIAYRARGTRDGAEPYEAICTSSYVCIDGYWWLTHHQQTQVTK
ncbi:hypothetical protein ASD83_14780 [Devosia sp. Root685]|nr:hypothetical protein ASD83_14780 [Devosia sp. Root685]